MLTKDELKRYSRHIPVIGKKGQEKLKQTKVLIVGAGGLGSPASLYLAAAGIGTLGIVDFDIVAHSNLHRQVLHSDSDVGKEKTLSAKETLERTNPHTCILIHNERLTEKNAEPIIKDYDIILDGSDSLGTKLLVSRVCRVLKKPLVYGAAVGTEGQLAVFLPDGPCLNCLIQAPQAPSCSSEGVLATTPGIIGLLQAAEALKLALGQKPVDGVLIFNSEETELRKFSFSRRKDCPVCGSGKQFPSYEITPKELANIKDTVQLVDVREKWEWGICHIEGAVLIPLGSLEKRAKDLEKSRPVVTYCHTGVRSLFAARALARHGFKARSLQGGIARWADELEPEMERY